jgi:hypothetical protein
LEWGSKEKGYWGEGVKAYWGEGVRRRVIGVGE